MLLFYINKNKIAFFVHIITRIECKNEFGNFLSIIPRERKNKIWDEKKNLEVTSVELSNRLQ